MSAQLLLTYIAVCFFLAITPGPNMALVIANTLRGGLGMGLRTIAGTTTGLAVIVGVAAVGMSSVMAFMATWFDVVRWCGALYLAYLGARQLWSVWRAPPLTVLPEPASASSAGLFAQGLLVALSNPKALLFLGAFLPQFVDPTQPAFPQLAIIPAVFVVVLAAVDVATALAVARARTSLDPRRFRILDGLSGVLLLAGGALLAAARRS
jgi:threonine/homoserine/homoserine lactone efflux protein